jgi:hypothetical protein
VTVDGNPLHNAWLTEPSTGNWTIDVEITLSEDLVGTVAIELAGSELRGTVVHGAQEGERWRGRIEGGGGGLRKPLQSRHYTAATVSMILGDVAADSGETLSGEISPGVLSRAVANWTRPIGSTSRAVADLAEFLELNWRVQRDGTIWVGSERYEPIELEHITLSREAAGAVVIAPAESPAVVPGSLFDRSRVADVLTELTPSSLRQTIWLKQDDRSRIVAVFRRLFDRFVGKRLDCSGSYPARVVSQAGDDSLEVLIDDERLRGDGLRSVPIRLGIPGARCEVAKGARVRVHFDEQDPSKPFAALWDTNLADVTVIEIGGSDKVVRKSDLEALFDNWTVVANDGGAALKAVWTSAKATIGSDTVKIK